MIEVATILSAILRHVADFVIIAILLVGYAVVGFWVEYQAGNAIAALKERLALQARVKRDVVWTTYVFMRLIECWWASFVWGYAFAWFLFNDRVKLAAYQVLEMPHDGLLAIVSPSARRS